jgi:hypothetical protein
MSQPKADRTEPVYFRESVLLFWQWQFAGVWACQYDDLYGYDDLLY